MLSEEEKREIEREEGIYSFNLHPSFIKDSNYIEKFKYLARIGKPLFILKARDYSELDDVLRSANVILCVEYDGEISSADFEKKEKEFISLMLEHVGVGTLEEKVDQTLN